MAGETRPFLFLSIGRLSLARARKMRAPDFVIATIHHPFMASLAQHWQISPSNCGVMMATVIAQARKLANR